MIQGEQPSAPTVASEAPAEDSEEDLFVTFVGIVDDLLGSDLPEEVVSQFINSDEFGIYQEVAGDPDSASDDLRAQFVSIVDAQLGNMSEESVNSFVASADFEIYSSVATHYQA